MSVAGATILDVCSNPALFAPWFRRAETWRPWFAFLRSLFGLPLDDDDGELFERCTGRPAEPGREFLEAWLICGRRAGKSFVLALVAVFLACFIDWSRYLTLGERGTIMVIAADRRQARVIFRYMRALLKVPVLASLIERETADTLDLANGITIEILTASFRTVRGYTLIAALCDEIAFWRSEDSANPDVEILAAIRPAMATIPGARLFCASSPYARRGALWTTYRHHYGKPDSVLVWKADTRTMNPTVPQSVIDEAIERDPASAAAEYGAEFRVDVETFMAREVVESAVIPDRTEMPPADGIEYFGFVDPSGGSSDSMTLAIAHREEDRAILDAVREVRPPFSPESVVIEFAGLLKSYGITTVTGDRYAGEWPRERFRLSGIEYEPSARTKSEIFQTALPIFNSGRAEILDNQRLISQFCSLERRTARGGRDSIDHAPGAHDDLCNAGAGALVLAAEIREAPQPARMVYLDFMTR